MNATPKAEWVIAGDTVRVINGMMTGKVDRIIPTDPLPYCLVRWENGSIGRHSITQLIRNDRAIAAFNKSLLAYPDKNFPFTGNL